MLMKAWLSTLQKNLVRGTRDAAGLQARRRDRQTDAITSAEMLEERALLTALVINSDNLDDFARPNEGIVVTNADMAGFDSLVIESVSFGGIDTEAIDIDLSGINLTALAIENVEFADYVGAGIDITLDSVTGLDTIAVEDTGVDGDGAGLSIQLTGGTDVEGLTVDDSDLSGVQIIASAGSTIGHGVIMESRLTGGVGVEGILLQMDQANADNFHIIDNSRISSTTRDAILIDLVDAPSDGITISGNSVGASNPVDIQFLVDGDTFSQPFSFTNPARNGEFVTRIFLDIEPAGLEFDEDPITGQPFQALNGTDATTGLDTATTTLTTLNLTFTDFNPAENFDWEIDLDRAGGIEASIDGADMIGSQMTFEFDDGKVISGVLVGVPASSDSSMFSQSAGDEGANGIHITADNSPLSNLAVTGNRVSGTPGSSFVIDTFNRSDVTGLISENDFLSSGTDGVVFNMTDGNFQGGIVNNNVSAHAGHGILFNGKVTRSGLVERVFEGGNDTIVIESTFHQLQTDDIIILQGLLDDQLDQAYPGNGHFRVTRLSNNTFSLKGLTNLDPPPRFSDGQYDGGGTWYIPEIGPDGTARGLVSFDLQSEMPTGFVQDASNDTPIVIESIAHGLSTGDLVRVSNVAGNTAANGVWPITFLDVNRFQLDGTAGNGDYDFDDGFGTWTGNVITGFTTDADTGEIIINAPAHGLASGDRVRVTEVQGDTGNAPHNANGTHVIRRINDNAFKLVGVESNGDYTDGGHYLAISQETITGDFLQQAIAGNAFTSNEGAGLQVDLGVGIAFRADVTSNQFRNNLSAGLHVESESYGVGSELPLDLSDPTAIPADQDISFNVNIGTVNADDGNIFDRNREAGIRLLAQDSGTGSFEIRNNLITNTIDTGDSTFRGDGIHVRLEGDQANAEAASILSESVIDSNVIGVDNQGNDGRGMAFSMEERTRIQDLQYSNNSVVNNGDDGFGFERRGDARLNNVRVTKNKFENNAGDGADFRVQNTSRDTLDFRFDENDITNNEHYGIRISALADASIRVDLENNTVDKNGRNDNGFHPADGLGNQGSSGGIGFLAFQNVEILMNMTGNRIVDNRGDGFSMDAQHFFDQMRVIGDWESNTFSNNDLSGVRNNGIAFGTFNWTNNTFNANGEDGVRSVTLVDNADFFERRIGGAELGVIATNNEFRNNAANGLHLGQAFSAVLGDGSVSGSNDFSDNGEDGLKITQGSGQNMHQRGLRRTIVADRNTFRDNGGDGIDIGQDFMSEGGNLLHGDESMTMTDIRISNATIVKNGGDGVEYLADPLPRILPVVGGGQDDDTYYFNARSSLTVRDSDIRDNTGRGVDVLNRLEEDSFVNIVNNDINDNGLSGVYVVNTASPNQLQSGPSDTLVQELNTVYNIEREDFTPLFVSTLTSVPHLEIRIEDNEIESNGTDAITSTVPINLSIDNADNGTVPDGDWTHETQQIPGSLGGVVIRVGSIDAPIGYETVDTFSELNDFGGVDATVIKNTFQGNFGTEIYFDNFTSVVAPLTTGDFNCSHAPLHFNNGGAGRWSRSRDPVSRFDLVFAENTGNSLDVINGFAFQDNWEPEFKSRHAGNSAPPNHNHGNDGPGPHTFQGRRRNSTRTLGWSEFDLWQLGLPTQNWFATCNDGSGMTGFLLPSMWAFDGEGTSAWRVEPGATVEDNNFSVDESLGESSFSTIVDLGDSAAEIGALEYQWDTGFTPYSLSPGEVFNISDSSDFIPADDFEENDSFLAASQLGGLGGLFSVNAATSDGRLTIESKGDRDYYAFEMFDVGTLDVTLFAETAATSMGARVYWVNPDVDVEERPLSFGQTVTAGATRTQTFNINGTQNQNLEIRKLYDYLTELDRNGNRKNESATIIVEILGEEFSNIGTYTYGTVGSYELTFDVPGNGQSDFNGGDGDDSSSGGGSGGSGDLSQPGPPRGEIQDITPDPRSTGVPEVEITFNEDVINVDITNFKLTRDGEEIDISDRTVVMVTPMDYTLDLTGLAQEDGVYKLTLLKSDITDIDNNKLVANDNDTWTVNTSVSSFLDFRDSQIGDGEASDDDGNSGLRAAVQEANAVVGTDIIRLPAGTYDLSLDGHFEVAAMIGDLNITEDLRIVGEGAGVTIIDANQVDRIFHVAPGVTLTLEGVTLTNGEAHDGGAILNEGTLILINTNITNSRAFNQGGGIYNTGVVSLDRSSVVLNAAGSRGGGIFNSGDLSALNSTVSSNTAVSRGAGIFNEGNVDLNSVTVAMNAGGARGGGIANEDETPETDYTFSFGNTLVAANESDFLSVTTGNVFAADIDGDVDSRGNNLVGFLDEHVDRILGGYTFADLLGGTADQNDAIDAKLANLVQTTAADGNGTYRHNIKAGSPAIDAGNDDLYPNSATNRDQVLHPRFLDGDQDAQKQIDIGAIERYINRPVPFFTISANPAGIDERVVFDAEGSSHTLSEFQIVSWEWDYDYDGITFDVDATGETVTNRFQTAGIFTVALRVTDNNVPPKTAILTKEIEIGVTPGSPIPNRPFEVTSDSTPTLSWIGGAADFQIQLEIVNADGTFTPLLDISGIQANQYTIPNADDLPAFQKYRYRVRGRNGAGFGDWSDYLTFRVKDIKLRKPRKLEFDPTPTFQWTGVLNALRYELFIIDTDTDTEVYRVSNLPGGNTQHTLPVALPVGNYLSRVVAYDQDDIAGDKSAPRRFSIVTPEGIAPEPITVDSTARLAWTDVNAPFHEVEVREVVTDNLEFLADGIPGRSISTSFLNNGDYYFRVRAVKADGEVGHWSPRHNFTVDTNHLLNQVAPIGPIGTRVPLFQWDSVGGIRRTELRISRLSSGASVGTIYRNNSIKDSEFQLPDSEKLRSGSYRWFIRWVSNDGVRGPWASEDFEVAQPLITFPGQNDIVQTRFPDFMWSGFSVFDTYELRVDNTSRGLPNVIRERGLTSTNFTPSEPLGNDDYRVRVRGFDAEGGKSSWSPWIAFTIAASADQGPVLISPANGAFTSRNPTFVWGEVNGAFTYELLIKEIRGTGQPLILEITGIPNNPDANGNVSHNLVENLPSGRNFRWWVRAITADNEAGPYSAPENFRTVSTDGVDQTMHPEVLPEATELVREGVVIASLGDQITIHPALPAQAPVDNTTVTLKGLLAPQETKVAPATAATPLVEPVEVDSVMADWTGSDWCSEAHSDSTVVAASDVEVDAGAGGVDERLLLAAGLPLLFGRKRKKRDEKKKQ